jgi:hypothetical protein
VRNGLTAITIYQLKFAAYNEYHIVDTQGKDVLVDDAADKVIAVPGGNDVLPGDTGVDRLDTAWTLLSRLSSLVS